MLRENQTIVFNIFLHGPPASGRRTILNWLVEHGSILDMNFLKAIQFKQAKMTAQINDYMKRLKDLPRLLKHSLDVLIRGDEPKIEEAKTYYEVSSLQIRELIKSYDEEINREIIQSVKNLLDQKPKTQLGEKDHFSFVDIVGSSPNMIYRIHYVNKNIPGAIEFDNFLSGIDGLIFVWDAQMERLEENSQVFEELLDNLPNNKQYPLVIALNKSDLPRTIKYHDLIRILAGLQFEEKLQTTLFNDSVYSGLTVFETIGLTGVSLKNILMNCVRMITNRNQELIQELREIIIQEAHG